MKLKSCKEATRLMSEQLDHPLPLYKLVLLKIHLAMCINCVYFGRQIKALKNLFGKYKNPKNETPSHYASSLSDEARQRMKSSLRNINP
jgi:hypothetical protein